MSRLRTAALLSAAMLLATGCGDAISSMTQHWFYGYVTSLADGELCVSDARTEDTAAERCFHTGEADLPDVAEGDLVKVQYERDDSGAEDDGHGGGTAIAVQMVRKGGQSDG